jgi:hypothetical protein
MDISTELMEQIVDLLMREGRGWREADPDASAYEIESGVRRAMQTLGAAFLGAMYRAEEGRYVPSKVACDCGGQAEYQRRRRAKSLSSFGWVCWLWSGSRSPLSRLSAE